MKAKTSRGEQLKADWRIAVNYPPYDLSFMAAQGAALAMFPLTSFSSASERRFKICMK
jgi:hypothetical protein